jgi:hypothetical protein
MQSKVCYINATFSILILCVLLFHGFVYWFHVVTLSSVSVIVWSGYWLYHLIFQHFPIENWMEESTSVFKYDRDYLCVNKSQFVPVIFEPPCTSIISEKYVLCMLLPKRIMWLLHHWQCLQLQNIMETATNRSVMCSCVVVWYTCKWTIVINIA